MSEQSVIGLAMLVTMLVGLGAALALDRGRALAASLALETAGGVLIGLGSCLALLAIGAFWCLVFVAVARVALG